MELLKLDAEKFKEEKLAEELNNLLEELESRNLNEASIDFINKNIKSLNDLSPEAATKGSKISSTKNAILKHLEKEYKLVTPKYYATMWLPLGMTAFGIPIGAAMYVLTKNAAFMGLGLPIGLALGNFYGASLDKKAAKENRVLDLPEQKS